MTKQYTKRNLKKVLEAYIEEDNEVRNSFLKRARLGLALTHTLQIYLKERKRQRAETKRLQEQMESIQNVRQMDEALKAFNRNKRNG